MNIIDVFAVYGDFGNFGGGNLIGVFDDREKAEKSSKGRGSLDCGGDARIEDRKAIQEGNDLYLLALDTPIPINKEITPNTRPLEEGEYSIVVKKVKNRMEFMKLFRKKTGSSVFETKSFMDRFDSNGKAEIRSVVSGGTFLREEAMAWKQEVEAGNIAELEIL